MNNSKMIRIFFLIIECIIVLNFVVYCVTLLYDSNSWLTYSITGNGQSSFPSNNNINTEYTSVLLSSTDFETSKELI